MFRFGLALLLAGPVLAADAPDARTLALAAGYKAAFLCSGMFTAGQSEAQVAADDLSGIYPEYQPHVTGLRAVVDRYRARVSVAFAAGLPPRVAMWRPLLGCAQLPVGAGEAAVAAVPALTPDLQRPDLAAVDRAAWPLGDAKAQARLPKGARARLDGVVGEAFGTARFGGINNGASSTTAVIVLKDGKIVAERYRGGWDMHTPQRTWSVAKSLTATLVGRAVALGRIDVAAPAGIAAWPAGDPRAAITTEQLLRMNSGLWTAGPGNRTDAVYLGGASVVETAAAMPLEAAPGTRFNYANNDILLAALGLEARLGPGALGFAFTELLWPLGMTRTTPETDWQGHFILSSQVWMTARDLARLALVYERGGLAPDGKRVLPADWAGFVAKRAGAQPAPRAGRGGYGAGFWVFGAADGLPEGTYAMLGNRGQLAVIVPSRRLVVVRRGFDAGGGAFDTVGFVKAVLGVLG